MPFQNRVSPFGTLTATPERGAWTGNRGVIHNAGRKIVRNYVAKYWITCVLEYKNFQIKVMTPNRWTELFFLDEATAFAAGHRPCGFCRYPDFKRFKTLWLVANSERYALEETTKIDVIDALIHQERLDENGSPCSRSLITRVDSFSVYNACGRTTHPPQYLNGVDLLRSPRFAIGVV